MGGGVHPQADTLPWHTPPGRYPLADTPYAPWQTPPGRHPHPPGGHTPSGQTPLGRHPWQTPPPPIRPLQRTVRILLECIRASKNIYQLINLHTHLWVLRPLPELLNPHSKS